jgi:tetratricopeptide (TPR) repeat protein
MPYKPYWLQRLPEILVTLKDLPDKVIDRPTFETIFRLRRRRAIELMHSLGSCRGRRGYVLDRCMLLQRLESMNVFAQYRWEEQVRAERVIQQLNGSKAKAPNGSNGSHDHTMRIVLEFADKGELTQKLLNLLQAACDGSGHSADVITTKQKVQYGHFEQAIKAFWRQSFREAEGSFAKASVGPDRRISTSAETYLRTCRRRMQMPCTPESFDERYTYGVTLLNDGRLSEARKQFESALRINPGVDYVYYALAACFALCGDMANLHANLSRAIDLQPRNRVAARSDPDFQAALNDLAVRELLSTPLKDA